LIAIESWVAGIPLQQKNVAALAVPKALLPAALEEIIDPAKASKNNCVKSSGLEIENINLTFTKNKINHEYRQS
jgi:hypothetical protein